MSNTRKIAAAPAAAASVAAFDVDALTLGDLEEMERYGVGLDELQKIANLDVESGKLPPARVLTVVAWMMGKQADPTLTIAKCRGLTLDAVLSMITETAEVELSDAEKN